MTSFPQLRVRGEHSFRAAYGPLPIVADRLAEIGCTTACLVDTAGTWGHVRWEQELTARGIQPGFGAEFRIHREDGRKPACWALALDTAQFYRLSSSDPHSVAELAEAPGILRFPGGALDAFAAADALDALDYVDVSPATSPTAVHKAIKLAKAARRKLILTSDVDYPAPRYEPEFMAWVDGRKVTPQWILDDSELRGAFRFLDDKTFKAAKKNTCEIAERLAGVKLRRAPIISVDGNLLDFVEAGKRYRLERGHLREWTPTYEARLQRELKLIAEKQFESYFIVVADMVVWAKERMLVGPARGSSAGSLVCYLLRITEVDPLVHNLLFERFIDVNRNDLPDIDIDFSDRRRELVFEYLSEKYGTENVARIGSVNTLKPRSVMAHVGKKMGIPHAATFGVLNVLIEYSSGDSRYGKGLEDTMNNTEPGRQFMERYPEAALMGALEGHASHTGVHAAGVIVSNQPVIEYCTVRAGVAQIDKVNAEYLNLLKIDALGLRTLGVIEDAGCVTNEELYGLSLDDPEVFDVFNQLKFAGVFQFEGAAQRRVSALVNIDSFRRIDHITALARPGPLGGGATDRYIARAAGREDVTYRHPSMVEYLGDTLGVVLYQEQVMRIVRELGQFSWEETSVIRKAMSGRKGKEFFDRRGELFIEGAAKLGVMADEAQTIWDEICNFGAWGMNASHTCSYAIISYWCAYMKRHYPLEYAAACLRSAKDDDQTVEILRELVAEGVDYVPFDPARSGVDWAAVDGQLMGGFKNLTGVGPVKAAQWVARRSSAGLTDADLAKLAKHAVKFTDLTPGRTLWGDIYDNPQKYGIHGPVKLMAKLKDDDRHSAGQVIIGRVVTKQRRDMNELLLVSKRNGRRIEEGETRFMDLFMVDDSVSKPVRVRVPAGLWAEYGSRLVDTLLDGEDWLLIRGRWLEFFQMMTATKIRCLTRPELLANEKA